MFENPRRGRQARNFTTNVPKILDLKSSSEQIFLEHWHWVPLHDYQHSILEKCFAIFERIWYPFEWLGVSVQKKFSSIWTAWAICSEKIVVRLNSLCYPFQKECHPFERLGPSLFGKNCHGLAHTTGVHERNTVPYARFVLKKRHGFCAKAREKNMQRHRLGTL